MIPQPSHAAAASKKKQEILQWSSSRNFAMALVCWTVGLGNCWRFPVAASMYGAGAFLLPYVVETVFIAIPFSYMEIGLGQFSSQGPVGIWELCPILKGVGYASVFVMAALMVYYHTICSYLLFYFFASLSTILPWSICDPAWAKPNCFTFKDNSSIRLNCIKKHGANFCDSQVWENSATQYWTVRVLKRDATEHLANVRWEIICCSCITGFLLFLLNCKGTKSIEKVVAFLSIFPYLELAALLFVTLLDPGSGRGIRAFLMPDFPKLWTISSWMSAFVQILFSIGLGLGGLVTLGSQSFFRSSVHLEAIAINLIDIASSICYGMLVFSFLGALSYNLNISMEEIVGWEDALLFAKVPMALTRIRGIPQIWAAMFFSGIYILGLRSQSLMMATVLNTVYDSYGNMLNHTVLCSALASILIVLLEYPFYTHIGSILLSNVDNMIAGPCIMLICWMEAVGIVCVYGITHFVDDMHFMLGFRASIYWQLMWMITPAVFSAMLSHSVYSFVSSRASTSLEIWIQIVQWFLFGMPLLLFLTGIVSFLTHQRNLKCSKLFKPSWMWGPTDPILKKSREMFTAHSMTKEYMYRQTRLKAKIDIQNEDEDDYF